MDRTTPAYKDCKIIALPQKYQKIGVAMALQKDSPYLWVFDEQILRMYESGDLDRIHITNDPPTHFCGNKSGSPLGI